MSWFIKHIFYLSNYFKPSCEYFHSARFNLTNEVQEWGRGIGCPFYLFIYSLEFKSISQ